MATSKRTLSVLITGASSGIGKALAEHYAKTTAHTLFICGRNASAVVSNWAARFIAKFLMSPTAAPPKTGLRAATSYLRSIWLSPTPAPALFTIR